MNPRGCRLRPIGPMVVALVAVVAVGGCSDRAFDQLGSDGGGSPDHTGKLCDINTPCPRVWECDLSSHGCFLPCDTADGRCGGFAGFVCDSVQDRCVRGDDGTNGVTATEIKLGTSAGYLTGGNVPVAGAAVNGLQAWIHHVNAAGGIHGRKITLDVRDDGSEPTKAAENTTAMLTPERRVFALVGYVGDEGTAASLPLALEHKVPLFGAISGIDQLRRSPPDRYVFNYRVTYAEQAREAAVWLYSKRAPKIHPRNIAVFAQGTDNLGRDTCTWEATGAIGCKPTPAEYLPGMNKMDAFGRAGFEGIRRWYRDDLAFQENEVIFATHTRNQRDVEMAVQRFLTWLGRPKPADQYTPSTNPPSFDAAIILQVITDPAVDLVVTLRDQIESAKSTSTVNTPYTLTDDEVIELKKVGRLVFAGTALSDVMGEKFEGKSNPQRYCDSILAIQVVPHPTASSAGLVVDYREHLVAFNPHLTPDVFSLEGYVVGRLFGAALERLGPAITTEAFVDTLESMSSIDIGLPGLSFSADDHQASEQLWASRMQADCTFADFDLNQ